MTIAATAWAFTTTCPQGPLERLLLILMADDTDEFGVCITHPEHLARQAVVPRGDVDFVLERMVERGILLRLRVPESIDGDLRQFSFFLMRGWEEREATGAHPILGDLVLA